LSRLPANLERIATPLSADRKLRNQYLAGADEKLPSAQYVEHRLPAVAETRRFLETQVVDIHVTVGLVLGFHPEGVHFPNRLLARVPVRHVVKQIKHPPA
jgi:hypothetical protein